MTGPSGVDAPAPAAPQMIGDPFRAFAAASQGDWDRAVALMTNMGDADWRSIVEVVSGLNNRFDTVWRARLGLAHPTDPAASSAAAAPSPTQHGHE